MLGYDFINDAFNKMLREAVGPDIGIARKNKKFTPKANQMWLKAINAPASTYAATLGDNGLNEIPGFYQVTVYSPLNTGTSKQNQILDSIRKKFKLGLRIPCPDDHTIRIVSLDFSQGGQTSLNDFTKGGVEDNWDVNFITIYWSAREPR